MRELLGLDRKLREIRGTKAAQESKKVALQQVIEGYRQDLERPGTTERADQIERELQKAEEQLAAVEDSISTLNFELRSQVRQIRETLTRVFDKDLTLAERVRTLFREQGITIVSILTAIGMTSDDYFVVVVLDGSNLQLHVAWSHVQPNPKGEVYLRAGVSKGILVARYRTWEVDGTLDCVLNVCQEQFLGIEGVADTDDARVDLCLCA